MSPPPPPREFAHKCCGTCYHGVRSAAFDPSLIACSIRLEYRHADHQPTCEHYRCAPAGDDCRG